MEFGFGSFLDKFEARFGKAPTTALLFLMALAVASFCVNVAATFVIGPTISLIQAWVSDDPETRASITETVKTVFNLLLFVIIAVNVVSMLDSRRDRKEIARIRVEYDEFLRAANEFWADSSDYVEALYSLASELETARTAKQRREVIYELRDRIAQRRAQYLEKSRMLNDNIAELKDD